MYKASAGCPSCLCTTAPPKGNCEKQNTTDRLKLTSTVSDLNCAHPRLGCDRSRPVPDWRQGNLHPEPREHLGWGAPV